MTVLFTDFCDFYTCNKSSCYKNEENVGAFFKPLPVGICLPTVNI